MPTAYVQGPSGVTQPGEDNQQEPRRTPTASRQFADLVFASGGQEKNVEDEPGEWASSGWAMWDPSWPRACCETGSTWSFGTLTDRRLRNWRPTERGWADSPAEMAAEVDVIITCLPSPAISAAVMEADDGILAGLASRADGCDGVIWAETDEAEVRRLAGLVTTAGGSAVDCPVSGGCHRTVTGNISIFAGCDRSTFERILPVLATMGRHILHTGRWAQPRSSRWSPTTWPPPTWCPCAKV